MYFITVDYDKRTDIAYLLAKEVIDDKDYDFDKDNLYTHNSYRICHLVLDRDLHEYVGAVVPHVSTNVDVLSLMKVFEKEGITWDGDLSYTKNHLEGVEKFKNVKPRKVSESNNE